MSPVASKLNGAHGELGDSNGEEWIIPALSYVFQQLVNQNDALPADGEACTSLARFNGMRPPSISVRLYLERMAKYSHCSNSCFIVALAYVDRIIKSDPHFRINSLNVHRVLITSVMVAAKFYDDFYYNNQYYAKVGGVPRAELNTLELDFLFKINFDLHLHPDEYNRYNVELYSHMLRRNGNVLYQAPSLLNVTAGHENESYETFDRMQRNSDCGVMVEA